jgi:hypothetical protein
MKKIALLLGIAGLAFVGCDYVDVPQQAGNTPVIPTSDTIRRVLVEDFTGHTCINCPDAARMLDSLQHIFPDQIVGLAVHYDFFAEPCPPHPLPNIPNLPANAFAEDFRALAEDADYNTIFGASGFALPCGMVNHYGFPSNIPTQVADWPSQVATILAQPITAYLKINPTYNSTTRSLNLTVDGKFMVDTTGTYNLVVMLVEDSLIGCQLDDNMPNNVDTAYVFKHVLRGSINSPGSVQGVQVMTGTIAANSGFSYTLPSAFSVSSSYNAAHCRIVAYLYNTADQGILQAAEVDLQ